MYRAVVKGLIVSRRAGRPNERYATSHGTVLSMSVRVSVSLLDHREIDLACASLRRSVEITDPQPVHSALSWPKKRNACLGKYLAIFTPSCGSTGRPEGSRNLERCGFCETCSPRTRPACSSEAKMKEGHGRRGSPVAELMVWLTGCPSARHLHLVKLCTPLYATGYRVTTRGNERCHDGHDPATFFVSALLRGPEFWSLIVGSLGLLCNTGEVCNAISWDRSDLFNWL